MDFNIIIYVALGVLPSLTWLFYYLSKDLHPEPKRMIIKIFFWGVFISIPVFFVEIGFTNLLSLVDNINPLVWSLTYWFFIISFTEEFFKYIVIKVKVINSPHLDEPLDVMLYMVVAALGFAAIENVLYLFAPVQGHLSLGQIIDRTLLIDFFRFIGAVFLHTLCSAVIGYSLAISFCEVKGKRTILVVGILMATLLHGIYDFSIMELTGYIQYAIPIVVILTLAFLVFSGFEKLKKMKSICKIQ
ncbi:MAG: PrsW family glutamic-type intramembrane protease [Candidatus Staskawiczbacteria bacterium]|nr:PrsW family glutamic-type intramembrane protease [Candidatus Staskawiczbacteria bacterium]